MANRVDSYEIGGRGLSAKLVVVYGDGFYVGEYWFCKNIDAFFFVNDTKKWINMV